MKDLLKILIEEIGQRNPLQAKSLNKFYMSLNQESKQTMINYLNVYIDVLNDMSISLDEAIDAYNDMVKSILKEQIYFRKYKRYRYSTIEETNKLVYSDKHFMRNYMIGVGLSQFLWENHSMMFNLFKNTIPNYKSQKYLEIGPGHGLFFVEAIKGKYFNEYYGIDISETSLEMTRKILNRTMELSSNYELYRKNILEFHTTEKFDFITMGEVLEHVEKPKELLLKINGLLNKNGKAYISTCANAPVIDHIYLFNNVEEIRELLKECKFKIEDEIVFSNDNTERLKWTEERSNVSYASIVSKL